MLKLARLIGGAGTGKTTELLRIMEAALPGLGNDPLKLGLASFTRAARAEAAARASAAWDVSPKYLEEDGWFRTIHSVCKRCLEVSGGQLITDSQKDLEWISNALGVRLSTELDDDSGRQRFIGDPVVAAALNCWSLSRTCLLPLETVVRRMRAVDDCVPDFAAIVRVSERYEMQKRLDGRVDFTDLLSRFAGIRCSPLDGVLNTEPEGYTPPVEAWLFDEQQDASPLLDAVCKRLVHAPSVKWAYVVGDPFQCQPEGTPVLTAKGYKPIEELDPENDWLVAFNKRDGRFYGTGGGTRFRKAWRTVDSGELVDIEFSDGTKSVCTVNHKWLVRTQKGEAYATYVMRRGTRWRVGTVQMFAGRSSAKNGDFRLKMRMNQEDADSAWILRVSPSDRDARMYEQVVSCKYGIPQVTFRPPCGVRTNLDKQFIEAVFESLGDLTEKGHLCLSDHGLEPGFPLCVKADRAKNGAKASRFVQAANILPGIHCVPKLLPDFADRRKRGEGPRGGRTIGSQCEWVSVVSVKRRAAGEKVRVYSLEVERHHTYVTSNGIVTGNSIYGFAGSSSECFLSWPADKERTMAKSYRCPRPILELGERCLRRMSKGYFDRNIAPADHEGSVTECSLDDAISLCKPGEDWLFITRINYHANRLFAALHSHAIPCRWVKAPDGTTNRADGLRALFTLEKGEKPITGTQWGHAIALLPPMAKSDKRPILTRGTKTRWAKDHAAEWDFIFQDDLLKVGAEPALVEAIRTGEWCGLVNKGHEWRKQALKHGPEIAANPRIRVGTIHSVKGAEADNVVLLTTTGSRVERGAENVDQADEEHRIAYVGVTRARRNLYVVNESRMGRPVASMEVL